MRVIGARPLTLCLLMIGGLVLPGAQPAAAALEQRVADPQMLIRLEGERLTVELKDASMKAVLEEIGRQGRIEVIVRGELAQRVSADFRQLPLQEGLTRLRGGSGRAAVDGKNGKVEQLVLTAGPVAGGQTPSDSARAVARLMGRTSFKAFFAALLRPSDSVTKLDTFGDVIDSLSVEEAGDLLGWLRDKTLPRSTWEEALAPLDDVLTAGERAVLRQSLQEREVRQQMIKSFEQVQLFKTAQVREALEKGRR